MEENEYWWKAEHRASRPLPHVSDFVLEKLPHLISSIESDLDEKSKLKKISDLFNTIEKLFVEICINDLEKIINSKTFRLSVLDIKMCAMVIWHNGYKDLPISLSNILESICRVTGDSHILTYEDIILENPVNDIRTFFTKENIGLNEELFYRAHQLIEDKILQVAMLVRNAIALRYISEESVINIESLMKEANDITSKLTKELDKQHFVIFRKYLSATANLKGPSGAFSGTYPLIDLYWRGSSDIFKVNRDRYRTDNMYFPSFQRKEIYQLVETSSISIKSLAKAQTPGFKELFMVFFRTMKSFRQRHLASVKKHLTDVFNNKENGTMGDSETGTYLKNSFKNTEEENL